MPEARPFELLSVRKVFLSHSDLLLITEIMLTCARTERLLPTSGSGPRAPSPQRLRHYSLCAKSRLPPVCGWPQAKTVLHCKWPKSEAERRWAGSSIHLRVVCGRFYSAAAKLGLQRSHVPSPWAPRYLLWGPLQEQLANPCSTSFPFILFNHYRYYPQLQGRKQVSGPRWVSFPGPSCRGPHAGQQDRAEILGPG